MLMHLPEVQLDALYPAWRPVVTEQVVLRRSSLQEELARSRARGYTIDDGVVVSAPVFDESGEVQAAVGLAVRAATGRGELAASVRRAAAAISGDLHNHGKQLRAAG
jgi:DNA-binding IclR family transcriptional regulator